MTLDELRALADEYFEWPIAHNKSTVTMTSALLFAQHVLEKHGNAQAAENSVGVDTLRAALAEPVAHGCHVDLGPDQEPDGCVLDENRPHLCIYAKRLSRDGKDKTACKHWKPIQVKR